MALIASQLVWQIVAEGPTGAYADLYGRARAVAMSFYCRLAAAVVLIAVALSANGDIPLASRVLFFAALVVAQVLVATGEAFLEGSIEAWLRDEMSVVSRTNSEKAVDRAFGVSAVAQNVAIFATTATFLGLKQFGLGEHRGGLVVLAAVAAVAFLAGGVVATVAASRELFVRAGHPTASRSVLESIREEAAKVWGTIRAALVSLVRTESPAVRRIVAVLVIPFPSWVMLSWFYPAFERQAGVPGALGLEWSSVLLLGLSLGMGRVVGAWLGERVTRREEGRDVARVFERAVAANVTFVFIAASVLLLAPVLHLSAVMTGGVFVATAAVAKGLEEVVKLGKNRLLAVLVADAAVRATILSFVSIAQNAFGFTALLLAFLLTVPLGPKREEMASYMFFTCGALGLLVGVLLAGFGARRNTKHTGRA